MNKLQSLLKVDTNARVAGILFLMVLNVFILPFNLLYTIVNHFTGWKFKGIYLSQRNSFVRGLAEGFMQSVGMDEPPAWAFGCFYTIRLDMLDADFSYADKLGEVFKTNTKELLLGELIRHEQTHCHQWLKQGVLFNYLYTISATHAIRAEAEATVSQFIYYKEIADQLNGEDKVEAHKFVDNIIANAGDQLATTFSTGAVPCKDLLNRSELSLWLSTMDSYIDFAKKFNVDKKTIDRLGRKREKHLNKVLECSNT
jgi:hypothetical protein|nr:MAG TPA: hypothetical protein [Caudoviricetes sp.]